MLQLKCPSTRKQSEALRALVESSKLGWSLRYPPRRRLLKAVVQEWLPACVWCANLALQVDFLLLCFQRYPWRQSRNFFSSSSFLGLYPWVQQGAEEQHEIRGDALPDQHRAPLISGFRRRQSWKRCSFPPGISCLGAGKVVRDSDLN